MAKNKKETSKKNSKLHLSFAPIIIIVIILLFLLGKGLGFGQGFGLGLGKSDGDSDGGSISALSSLSSSNTIESSPQEDNSIMEEDDNVASEPIELNNNAVENLNDSIEKISVVENEYFYNNERISLEEFISKIKDLATNLIVEITDDNASLDAYENLTDELDNENIEYREK